jgi:hypothetical protein
MPKVMLTLRSPAGAPSLAAIRDRYGLRPEDLDERFGVVAVDPADHAYTILVERDAAARIVPGEGWEVEGPFSNPRIEPFGPPR